MASVSSSPDPSCGLETLAGRNCGNRRRRLIPFVSTSLQRSWIFTASYLISRALCCLFPASRTPVTCVIPHFYIVLQPIDVPFFFARGLCLRVCGNACVLTFPLLAVSHAPNCICGMSCSGDAPASFSAARDHQWEVWGFLSFLSSNIALVAAEANPDFFLTLLLVWVSHLSPPGHLGGPALPLLPLREACVSHWNPCCCIYAVTSALCRLQKVVTVIYLTFLIGSWGQTAFQAYFFGQSRIFH